MGADHAPASQRHEALVHRRVRVLDREPVRARVLDRSSQLPQEGFEVGNGSRVDASRVVTLRHRVVCAFGVLLWPVYGWGTPIVEAVLCMGFLMFTYFMPSTSTLMHK